MTNWKLDIGSLLIGLVLGILLVLIFRRLRPAVFRWQQRFSGRIQKTLNWARAGAELRFRSETVEYVRQYHLGRAWSDLEKVFVAPRVLAPPREVEPSDEPDWGAKQLNYLWPDLAAGIATPVPSFIHLRELLLLGRRTLLSAASGAGKSSLLAYSAYLCATAEADSPYSGLLSVIPVFVHLAELELKAITETGTETGTASENPMAPLLRALRRRSSPLTSPRIKDMLSRKLQSGQTLLLLDGWDELAPKRRAGATAWLQRLLHRFPDIRVVVAAPLTGYGTLLELEFTLCGLLPWRIGEVESFASQWTQAFPLSQPPHQSYYWCPGQTNLENSLRFWMAAKFKDKNGVELDRQKQRWLSLMTKSLPLFIDNMAGVPNVELGTDQEDDKTVDPLMLACWQRLAFVMLSEEKLALSRDEVKAAIELELAQNDAVSSGNVTEQQDSLARSTLFVTWSNGSTGFMNPLWRDFMAATHMARNGLDDVAVAHLMDPYWSDVLRFYVAQVGATELAAQLLAIKEQGLTRDPLFKVASWMAEAPDSGEWQRQTMILLGQIIRQSTFSYLLRLRAAAVLAQTAETGVFTFLSQLLERSDPFLRQAGTTALVHLGAEKVIDLLVKMMEDGDVRVRQAAVYALAWLHHPRAERPLLTALIGSDYEMSKAAAEGFAQNGADGLEILKEAIEDEDLQVRRIAIHGLTLVDEAWVIPLLVQIERHDKEWLVRTAASEALELVNARAKTKQWQPVAVAKQRWLVQHATQEGRTVPEGAATLPFLVQILAESTQSRLRVAAAASLGQLAAQEALPALETAARGNDQRVREAAYVTLCQIRRAYGDESSS